MEERNGDALMGLLVHVRWIEGGGSRADAGAIRTQRRVRLSGQRPIRSRAVAWTKAIALVRGQSNRLLRPGPPGRDRRRRRRRISEGSGLRGRGPGRGPRQRRCASEGFSAAFRSARTISITTPITSPAINWTSATKFGTTIAEARSRINAV